MVTVLLLSWRSELSELEGFGGRKSGTRLGECELSRGHQVAAPRGPGREGEKRQESGSSLGTKVNDRRMRFTVGRIIPV